MQLIEENTWPVQSPTDINGALNQYKEMNLQDQGFSESKWMEYSASPYLSIYTASFIQKHITKYTHAAPLNCSRFSREQQKPTGAQSAIP